MLHGVVAALGATVPIRPQRLASLVANERITGGPGLIALRAPEDGLEKGPTYRCRQLAIDVLVGVNKVDKVRLKTT
jgi:hypothetical protein